MGTAAKHGRRALVDMVRECIDAVNAQGAALHETRAEVAKAQNALVDQVKLDLASVDRRAQDLTFERMKAAKAHADERERLLRNEIKTVASEMEALTSPARLLAGPSRFWQRLRWLFTGKVPFSAR